MAEALTEYRLLPPLRTVKRFECFWQFALLGVIWTLQTSDRSSWALAPFC